ncbi:MAG: enoyl-CoA hydratase/isomerase family protein [Solirubrobacteraceae bacterium]
MQSGSDLPISTLQRAGLSPEELDEWSRSAPARLDSLEAAGDALSGFLVRGTALVSRLPPAPRRSESEPEAARALSQALTDARIAFLDGHAGELYDKLTNRCAQPIRLEALVYEAAGLVPGLVPTRAEMESERARPLAEKAGLELAQGLLLEHILALPRAGRHLIESMLAPTPEALERLAEFQSRGVVDFGHARVTRQGRAAVLELRNQRHLNAEDGATLGPTESAVDLILLDPDSEIGVFRGAVVDHPRYAGERIFGAGINLTQLYQGKIDFLFYLVRDLGYVNKLYRGLITQVEPARSVEKLWVAAVERYAIGGACQLLHVVDHVIAIRGSRLYLPARKEGIIPGASNLRLPRSVGDRAARQAIMSGREWSAGDADADLLVDEVVEAGEMDDAIDNRVAALTGSGLVNATGNRRVLRIGQEPIDLFREYMSAYAREQAYCHLSPALVSNLEQHWNAAARSS